MAIWVLLRLVLLGNMDLDGASPKQLTDLGSRLTRQGKMPEALRVYDKAILLQPTHAHAHHVRGNILRAMKQPSEALQALETSFALSPNTRTAIQVAYASREIERQNRRSRSANSPAAFTKESEDAIVYLRHALDLLGSAGSTSIRTSSGSSEISRKTALSPRNAKSAFQAHFELAEIHRERAELFQGHFNFSGSVHDSTLAEQHYSEAGLVDPRNAEVYMSLAVLLQGRFSKLHAFVHSDPSHEHVHVHDTPDQFSFCVPRVTQAGKLLTKSPQQNKKECVQIDSIHRMNLTR